MKPTDAALQSPAAELVVAHSGVILEGNHLTGL